LSANPNIRTTRCPDCQGWECGTVCRFLEGWDAEAYAEEIETREEQREYDPICTDDDNDDREP